MTMEQLLQRFITNKTSEKSLLMVLNAFHPEKTGRTSKMLEIALHFAEKGYRVYVLTKTSVLYSVLQVDNLIILPVDYNPNKVLGYIDIRYFSQLFFFPIVSAFKYRKILNKIELDYMYSPSNPWYNHMTAFLLKVFVIKKKCRWIAEFRDPIVDHPHLGKGLVRRVNSRIIERIIAIFSDKILIPKGHALTVKRFTERYPAAASKALSLPYFGSDFKYFHSAFHNDVSDSFCISYIGTFLPTKGNIVHFVYFLEGLKILVDSFKLQNKKIVFRYAGDMAGIVPKLVSQFKLDDYFSYEGYLNKKDVAEMQKSSDVLLLIQESKPEYSNYVISKFWDYVAAGRPILAIAAKDSLLSKLINQYQLGATARTVSEVYQFLKQNHENKVGEKTFKPNLDIVKKFSRENYLNALERSIND